MCGMRAKGAGYNNMDGVVHLMVSPGSWNGEQMSLRGQQYSICGHTLCREEKWNNPPS